MKEGNAASAYPAHQSRENLRTITGLRKEAIALDCRTAEAGFEMKKLEDWCVEV
jgi:hypothetical protein